MKPLVCWNCGNNLDDVPRPISRQAACSNCFNELHCCRLCCHYDDKRTAYCFEERADPPMQKENANFCDFFSPQSNAFEQKTARKSENVKSELDVLFANDGSETDVPAHEDCADTINPDDDTRKKLDDLFN